MENKVIGVEGMVGAGKTSICKELLNFIPNSIFIDGGNIYRGIIEAMYEAGLDFNQVAVKLSAQDELTPFELMKKLNVDFKIEDRATQIYINGKKISEEEIQSTQNSIGVSKIASVSNNKSLFKFAYDIINKYKENYNIIVSARGLAQLYPEMDYHIYVTASLEERTKRRYKQLADSGSSVTYEEVEKMITERDKMHEEAGFNQTCKNTVVVDVSDCQDATASCKKILEILGEEFLYV